MIWLKSIGVGLAPALVFAIVLVIGSAVLANTRNTIGFISFSWSVLWLALLAVFLCGFGWELWRLER